MKQAPLHTWGALLVGAVIALASPAASAEEHLLALRPERTSVTFTLKATGHEVRGVLPLESGQIRVDLATGAASGVVTVSARDATTGNGMRDREMHASVLESDRYPVITFAPNRLEGPLLPAGVSDVVLRGVVSIHGTEHPVAVPAKVRRAGDLVTAEATFEVPYVDWGLRNPSFFFLRVASVVSITVKVESDLRAAAGRP